METNKRSFDVVTFVGMNFPVRFIDVSEGEPHEGWEEMITQYTIVDDNFAEILRFREAIECDEQIKFYEDWNLVLLNRKDFLTNVIALTVDEFATLTDEEIKGIIEQWRQDLRNNRLKTRQRGENIVHNN